MKRKSKIKSAILDYINNNPDCTIQQIAEAIGTTYTYTAVLANQLFEEGRICYNTDGERRKHYRLGASELKLHSSNEEEPMKSRFSGVATDALIEELRRRGYKGEITKNHTYNL